MDVAHSDIYRAIEATLYREGPEEALLKAEKLPKSSNEDIRRYLQCLAKIHLFTQSWDKAESYLQLALRQYGENISLYSQLAILYYQQDSLSLWRESYTKLAHVLETHRPVLTSHSIVNSEVLLGKFDEEEGRLAEAITRYKSAHKVAMTSCPQAHRMVWVTACQILRLGAPHLPTSEISELYSQLSSLELLHKDPSLHMEIEHALLITELSLIGEQHAQKRLRKNLSMALGPNDENLLLFDYLEGVLAKGGKIPSELLNRFIDVRQTSLPRLSRFESILLDVALGKDHTEILADTIEMAPRLSPSNLIRCLLILFRQSHDAKLKSEIQNRMMLLTARLSKESRRIWLQNFISKSEETEHRLFYEKKTARLSANSSSLNLQKRKHMKSLIELLLPESKDKESTPSRSVDQVIQHLWACDFSPSLYHRLRMTAHRLNQEAFQHLKIPKLIHVSSDTVSLSASVSFVSDKAKVRLDDPGENRRCEASLLQEVSCPTSPPT